MLFSPHVILRVLFSIILQLNTFVMNIILKYLKQNIFHPKNFQQYLSILLTQIKRMELSFLEKTTVNCYMFNYSKTFYT